MIRLTAILAVACTASIGAASAVAADNGQGGPLTSATGVLLSFKENSIEVFVDGAVTKSHYPMFPNQGAGSLVPGKTVFPDNRITVALDSVHGPPTCMGITKEASLQQGSVTGQVLYNDGWSLVVKPKDGVADGFGQPIQATPEMVGEIQSVKVGDTVTVAFTSDAERHRIKTLTVVAKASPAKPDGTKPALTR